ncbi:MAG TPA: 16S rRNA (cytosine(1402)-N(4))-methyltransferase [Spirochaetia bacterium]|nr:MAG: 16S rRNA (cytosine(1402)-N(4))-methyltransferase [Spirochaetes bacterium GWB1_36_13]HCL57796.1 16S rRNA (cytosine(1402)-N(4))-methyltransferase [Spirochaetia bacterium]
MAVHTPVLLKEILDFLVSRPEGVYLDLTTGEGGHSFEIASRLNNGGKLICFDRDEEIQKIAKENLKTFTQVDFALSNFSNLMETLSRFSLSSADGILADLGLSMYHYKESEKGFSFIKDTPLDMTLDGSSPNAYDVVNSFTQTEIADILFQYGEERLSRRIAAYIVEYRKQKKIETTKELAGIIDKAAFFAYKKKNMHPATKSFQAIRIFVNQELENLEKMLSEALLALSKGGRLAVITYHSLEDRIVKNTFKNASLEKEFKILTKKPIIPTKEETQNNPSARSAKLRVIEKN